VVPVGAWVLAYYDRYAEERLACPAADRCDFVLVNLFHPQLGAPMTASAVRQWFRGRSPRPRRMSTRARPGCARRPRRSRRSAGTGGHNDVKETPDEPRRQQESSSSTLEPARHQPLLQRVTPITKFAQEPKIRARSRST